MKKVVITVIISLLVQAVPLTYVFAQESTLPTGQAGDAAPVEATAESPPAEVPAPTSDPGPAETPAEVPAEPEPEVVIVEQAPAEETQNSESAQVSESPQSSETDQDSAPASSLEETFNPNDTSTSETASSSAVVDLPSDSPENSSEAPTVPLETAPAADEVSTPGVGSSIEEIPLLEEEIITEILPPPPVPLVVLPDIEPTPQHTFAVKGGAIPTKKKSKDLVTETPNLSTSGNAGVLEVSGRCTDKYFVVLIYRAQEDYDANPGSYIFNKAFECQNGGYSYSIKELPPTLEDGTYYLLIGGQGETGSWSPITALIPVTIQNNEQ